MILESEAIAPSKRKTPVRKRKEEIPDYLVRETIDGIPFYYLGFREVMNKTKTFEEIMADSGLQWVLKNDLGDIIKAQLDSKQFKVLVGEGGSHADHRNNMSLDIAIFDKSVLTPDKITSKYIDVTPKVVIEIDVKVEVPDPETDIFSHFVLRKMRRLFAFGTEKIVWIFTKSKLIMVATPNTPLQILDWNEDVVLFNNISFNVAKHMEEEGILPKDA